jgi:hypothetical protein
MKFTYQAYEQTLHSLMDQGYAFTDYLDWNSVKKSVILRHDVDMSLPKAVEMSKQEKSICDGGKATYFVLLSTEFYNLASLQSRKNVDKIIANGGQIGLHFDETQYEIRTKEEMVHYVLHETELLSKILDYPIKTVSMHRPSKLFLESDMEFPGICNSYAGCFFKDMKYVSDSRRRWREDVDAIVAGGQYERINLLTHPVWYNRQEEADIREALLRTMRDAQLAYYDNLNENITDLPDVITRQEI